MKKDQQDAAFMKYSLVIAALVFPNLAFAHTMMPAEVAI